MGLKRCIFRADMLTCRYFHKKNQINFKGMDKKRFRS